MDSYPYRVFKERYPFLQEGVKPAVEQLARILCSRNLIPKTVCEAATVVTWTVDQKACELLKSLDSEIKKDLNSLYEFMAILRSMASLQYLFHDLNERLPEHLQLEVSDDPLPCEEEGVDGGITGTADQENIKHLVPGAQAYVLQPLYVPLPSTVTGQITVFQRAVPVYNKPPPIMRATSFDINEVTSHLPEGVLNRVCEELLLTEIANEMTHYDTIYTYFGLTRVKMEDITRRYFYSPERQRQEILFEWKAFLGRRATYKQLVYCFCQAKRRDLANFACQIVEKHYPNVEVSLGSSEVASPESGGEEESTHRSAHPVLSVTSEGLSPMIPFIRQQSQQHSSPPVSDSSLLDVKTSLPRNLTSPLNLPMPPKTITEMEVEEEGAVTLFSPARTLSGASNYSSQASEEYSFHTACSSLSINDESEEDTAREELQRELDKISTMYNDRLSEKAEKIRTLKKELDKKDKEATEYKEKARRLGELLAQKEKELASRVSHPIQETYSSEVDRLKQELEITKNYTETIDRTIIQLERECMEAQLELGTCQSQNSGLHKAVMVLRRKVSQSETENFTLRKEKAQLQQKIRDLENSLNFFFSNSQASCRMRSQSF